MSAADAATGELHLALVLAAALGLVLLVAAIRDHRRLRRRARIVHAAGGYVPAVEWRPRIPPPYDQDAEP